MLIRRETFRRCLFALAALALVLGLTCAEVGCESKTQRQQLLAELRQKHEEKGLSIAYAQLTSSETEKLSLIPFESEAQPISIAELQDRTVFGANGKYLVSYSNGFTVLDLTGNRLLSKSTLRPYIFPTSCSSGDWFAFQGQDLRSGFTGLIAVDLRGKTAHILATKEVSTEHPAFSRDCQLLLYSADHKLLLTDMRTQKTTELGLGTDGAISPDGRAILFRDGKNNFVLMDVQDKGTKRLFSGKDVVSQPFWSPDGDYLFFFRVTGGLNLVDSAELAVYRIRDGSTAALRSEAKGIVTARFEQIQWVMLTDSQVDILAHASTDRARLK